MKRFALFVGNTYYPWGGWQDFVRAFDAVSEAHAHLQSIDEYDRAWWHVVDLESGELASSGGDFYSEFQNRWDVQPKGNR